MSGGKEVTVLHDTVQLANDGIYSFTITMYNVTRL